MRKILVLEFISLDGVMQAPGGPDEDTSSGFKFGGWSVPFGDDESNTLMGKQMERADILLGRKTFDIFESYWPKHADMWSGINEVTKYVVSTSKEKSEWQNTVFLKDVEDIKKLKESKGGDIKVWGSGNLVQTLMKHDLVDEFWLKIYPVTLGQGKKLFAEGTIPASFTLTECKSTPSGIIFANYKRAGEVKIGSF